MLTPAEVCARLKFDPIIELAKMAVETTSRKRRELILRVLCTFALTKSKQEEVLAILRGE